MEKSATKQGGRSFVEVIKAIIIAVIISLLLVLLAAFLINILSIPDNYILIIVQVIKGISILIAVLISFKTRSQGWVKGIVAGILYTLIAFAVFSLLKPGFSVSIKLLNDVAAGAVTGLVSGIISVLIRRK